MKILFKVLLLSGILLSGSASLNAKEIYLSNQTNKDYWNDPKLVDTFLFS